MDCKTSKFFDFGVNRNNIDCCLLQQAFLNDNLPICNQDKYCNILFECILLIYLSITIKKQVFSNVRDSASK